MKTKIVIGFLLISQYLFGQNYQEWMRQKRTQIKYLSQQVAANRVYLEFLEKGYGIARDGLKMIQDIKQGNFNLHFNFFDSLKKVNPRIKNSGKVAKIVVYQLHIINNAGETIKNIRETGQFTNNELNYCKDVFDNLLEECLKDIEELYLIITDGELTMKDDERMNRIDRLYTGMQEKYSFTASFSSEMGILAAQRLSEQSEIILSKKLNGLK